MDTLCVKPCSFKGVMPCNVFLNEVRNGVLKLLNGDSLIINLSSSNHHGSHFIAIYILDGVEYFDPLGMPSIDVNINQAFTEKKLEIVHFESAIQPLLSNYCGYYCAAFLLWRQIGLDKVKFVQVFQSEKNVSNDDIVLDILKFYINEKNYLL